MADARNEYHLWWLLTVRYVPKAAFGEGHDNWQVESSTCTLVPFTLLYYWCNFPLKYAYALSIRTKSGMCVDSIVAASGMYRTQRNEIG